MKSTAKGSQPTAIVAGRPWPLGIEWIEAGDAFNFALFSRHATGVTLLCYSEKEPAKPVFEFRFQHPAHKTGSIWHCRIPAVELRGEPPPVPVMSVRLEQPPLEEIPPPELPKKRKPRTEREIKQIPIVVPKPLPNEAQAKIVLPKLEPKPKPEPKPKEEEKPPEPVPEPQPEAQPLPTVFRDVKPVKKVKPKYPREAEDAHIQGRVRVRLTVEVNGSVSEARILAADPPGVFDAAVMEAVVQYIFKRDGTSYQADQEIIFKLE